MVKIKVIINFSAILLFLIAFISITESATKPAAKKRSASIADFKQGDSIGLSCKRMPSPVGMRSRGHKIVFKSTTIIKTTSISISGEVGFSLRCTRDDGNVREGGADEGAGDGNAELPQEDASEDGEEAPAPSEAASEAAPASEAASEGDASSEAPADEASSEAPAEGASSDAGIEAASDEGSEAPSEGGEAASEGGEGGGEVGGDAGGDAGGDPASRKAKQKKGSKDGKRKAETKKTVGAAPAKGAGASKNRAAAAPPPNGVKSFKASDAHDEDRIVKISLDEHAGRITRAPGSAGSHANATDAYNATKVVAGGVPKPASSTHRVTESTIHPAAESTTQAQEESTTVEAEA